MIKIIIRLLLITVIVFDYNYSLADSVIYTPGLSCKKAKDIVDRLGDVNLHYSIYIYELVHREGGSCGNEFTAAPAFGPTLDNPQCFLGYRCKDRVNGGGDNGM
jgi:hypothetical protein